MLQNGCNPSLASPAAKVTACSSEMPTSNDLCGKRSIMKHDELPVGMAGVMTVILSFFSASSTSVWPKTSWNLGGLLPSGSLLRSPVAGLKQPGACQMVGSFSAGAYPLPLMVRRCSILGPVISLMSFSLLTMLMTLCPSMGPK